MLVKSINTVLITSLSSAVAFAAESTETLPSVDVIGIKNTVGMQYLDSQEIARRPTRNGTINELLRTNGAVTFSNTTNQSSQAGEISPELVSFHGEPYYNNAFLIDGLSNNDIMNPGFSKGGFTSVEDVFETAPTTLYIAPGAPESFQVDSSLLRSVTVYDSNVPAQYGSFTGGVIDAKLKDADPKKASGSISFRTTRSSWTKFHLSEDQNEDEFHSADATSNVQPEFVKRIYNVSVNQPLSDKTAVLLSYSRTQSTIPEYHSLLDQWQDERRLAQTWLIKGTHQLSDKHKISATAMYSPHKSIFYRNNTADGRYVSEGGGWQLSLNSDWQRSWGDINTTLAYSKKMNEVAYDAGGDSFQWLGYDYVSPTSVNYCSQFSKQGKCIRAYQGGFGTLRSTAETWTLKQDYKLRPLQWYATQHNLSLGWSVDVASIGAERPMPARYMYAYNTKKQGYPKNSTNVSSQCIDCIPGEQYQTHMSYFPAFSAKVRNNDYAIYLQDNIRWKRWQARAGVRVSYNSLLKNVDVAPRFVLAYDVFGDNTLTLEGGANRYYGGNVLAYELRSNIPPNRAYTRINDAKNGESGWTFDKFMNNSQSWKASKLKTPYSDEFSLGVNWRVANQIFNAQWVHRNSRDQFTPSRDEDKAHIMTNDGSGQSDSYVLSIRNEHPYQLGMFELSYQAGARYQRYRTNYNGSYDDALVDDIANLGRRAYYLMNNKRYASLAEMPPSNFNTPWSAFLELHTDIPRWNFRWTNSVNFRSGYKNYVRDYFKECRLSNQAGACGDWEGAVYDYRLKDYKQAVTLDWRFLWQLPLRGQSKLEVSLDVLNVTNKKVSAANATSSVGNVARSNVSGYETGRQYWLGVAYAW